MPARTEFVGKNTEKKEINFWCSGYGSSRTCCGWPLNFFFVTDECKNDITRFVSITRVNAITFILLITAAFASTVVVFIKGSFSVSSQFLSILFVADQFLQDSFGEASVWLDASLVEKCLKGMAPGYFSRYFKLKIHNIHNYDTRKKNNIVINRVKLESTKSAFFYKGADIFNKCI